MFGQGCELSLQTEAQRFPRAFTQPTCKRHCPPQLTTRSSFAPYFAEGLQGPYVLHCGEEGTRWMATGVGPANTSGDPGGRPGSTTSCSGLRHISSAQGPSVKGVQYSPAHCREGSQPSSQWLWACLPGPIHTRLQAPGTAALLGALICLTPHTPPRKPLDSESSPCGPGFLPHALQSLGSCGDSLGLTAAALRCLPGVKLSPHGS